MLRILNSQSRQKEEFKPLDPEGKRVTMYTCGPTVYDSLHIGHARAYVVPDVVRRYLESKGFQVRFVTNFTDVDDKIIKRAIEERRDWREIVTEYIAESHEILHELNVKTADAYPRATDHLKEMHEIVTRLLQNKNAYVASDGDVYFDTTSYARYGNLSGRKLEDDEAGASGRVSEQRLKVKKHPGDFVLWKLNKNDKDEFKKGGDAVPGWNSSWGRGRPGWHLECSAMSYKYLGVPFDIHCGGRDLLFPHHEDEKAQTECAYCTELGKAESVRYWVHNEFVMAKRRPEDQNISADLIDPATGAVKISKSLGNMRWVREMIWPEGPYDPMALRMMLLSSHYRSPIVFEPAMLEEAGAKLERIYNALETIGRVLKADATISWARTTEEIVAADDIASTFRMPLLAGVMKARQDYEAAMDDDFNTAGAVGAIFELVAKVNQELAKYPQMKVPPGDAAAFHQAATTIRSQLDVLGIRSHRATRLGAASDDSQSLMNVLMLTRQRARATKQFAISDGIRDALMALGYEIEDLPSGKWNVKKTAPKESCILCMKPFNANEEVLYCSACGLHFHPECWKTEPGECPKCGERVLQGRKVYLGGKEYRAKVQGARIL